MLRVRFRTRISMVKSVAWIILVIRHSAAVLKDVSLVGLQWNLRRQVVDQVRASVLGWLVLFLEIRSGHLWILRFRQ
jgi:hypothetical protein